MKSKKGAPAGLLWILFALVGIAIGTGGFTFFYAKGFAYLSSDPKACVNCHIMNDQYSSWNKSSHHRAASCNDCHVPHGFPAKYLSKARNGWNHSRAFTMQDFQEPIRITKKNLEILQHNCISCHQTMVGDIAEHGKSAANRCTECHRSVGHLNLD